MPMHDIEDIVADLKQGKMVIIIDDEDRENEGDLVVAAEKVEPSHINFMTQHARGLVCMPMTQAWCRQLQLPLMVSDNHSKFGTNFTVSIEAATGVTTGISAQDRARTIRVASNPNATPEDLVQPGHVFPIMAQPGGVLARAGHTEACCDLMQLAGLYPSAVLCEIMNEDGTMARKPQLEVFAKKHNLKIGTIADLIRYRMKRESTVTQVGEADFPTQYGTFQLKAYQDNITKQLHIALVSGLPSLESPAPVRVHVRESLLDVPGADMVQLGCEGRWPLAQSLRYIAEKKCGAVVMLGHQETAAELIEHIGLLSHFQKKGYQRSLHENAKEHNWRLIGVGSQILSKLGFGKLIVLSNPKTLHGISGFGLEVVEYVPFNGVG